MILTSHLRKEQFSGLWLRMSVGLLSCPSALTPPYLEILFTFYEFKLKGDLAQKLF